MTIWRRDLIDQFPVQMEFTFVFNNWKFMYENKTFNLFCDTESAAGSEENACLLKHCTDWLHASRHICRYNLRNSGSAAPCIQPLIDEGPRLLKRRLANP